MRTGNGKSTGKDINKMKLLYLGTAAAEGIPALFCECESCKSARSLGVKGVHTRSGALLDGVLKLDFGPDSYKQMLDNGLNFAKIHSVLITHSHEDHLDVDELNLRRGTFAHILTTEKLMTVYGNQSVGDKIKRLECEYLHFVSLKTFETVEIEGYSVTPLEGVHCVSREGGSFPVLYEDKTVFRSEDAFIYLIEKQGKRLLYAHDTDKLSKADMDYLRFKRLDLVSLDCTNGVLDVSWIGHMGALDDEEIRRRLIENGSADENTLFVANHFSHNGYPSREALEKLLPNFIVAHDGLEIEF